MTTPESIISDEEIIRVHAFANFGDMSPRDVVNKGVWKYSIGYSGGHTMQQILREHGLITRTKGYRASLTEKGKRYARSVLPDPFALQARAEKAEAEADKWMERAMDDCGEGLGLKAENERLREALTASVKFSDWVADQAGIDMDETILTVRVMPEGREVASKSWAAVQAEARAALERKEEGHD